MRLVLPEEGKGGDETLVSSKFIHSRNNSKTSSGSSGHVGGTRPGQTRKKPMDLITLEREEGGCWEGGGV